MTTAVEAGAETGLDLGRLLRYGSALASTAAGAIHVSAAVDHRQYPVHAALFFVAAAGQFLWAGFVLRRMHPIVMIGGAVSNPAMIVRLILPLGRLTLKAVIAGVSLLTVSAVARSPQVGHSHAEMAAAHQGTDHPHGSAGHAPDETGMPHEGDHGEGDHSHGDDGEPTMEEQLGAAIFAFLNALAKVGGLDPV